MILGWCFFKWVLWILLFKTCSFKLSCWMLFPIGPITIQGFFGTNKDFEFTSFGKYFPWTVSACFLSIVRNELAGRRHAGSSQIKGKQSHMGGKWVCSVHPQCCNTCVVVGVARGYGGWWYRNVKATLGALWCVPDCMKTWPGNWHYGLEY